MGKDIRQNEFLVHNLGKEIKSGGIKLGLGALFVKMLIVRIVENFRAG